MSTRTAAGGTSPDTLPPAVDLPAIEAGRAPRDDDRPTPPSVRTPSGPTNVRSMPRRRRWSPGAVTAVLIVASLSLMLLDVRGGPTDWLRAAAATVGGPLQTASSGLLGSLPEQVHRPDGPALQQQIDGLRRENDRLAIENRLLAEQLAALAGDRAAEAFADTWDRGSVTARVVAASAPPAEAAVTIDAGSAAGVTPDSAVVVPAGLVGRVVAVGDSTSTVQLLTSPDSGVAVRLPSRHSGLVQGGGDPHRLTLRHVDPLAPVRVGDVAVTLGSPDGRPFPRGIPVGTVVDAGPPGDVNRRIGVAPAADLAALDRVVVLIAGDDTATGEGER